MVSVSSPIEDHSRGKDSMPPEKALDESLILFDDSAHGNGSHSYSVCMSVSNESDLRRRRR